MRSVVWALILWLMSCKKRQIWTKRQTYIWENTTPKECLSLWEARGDAWNRLSLTVQRRIQPCQDVDPTLVSLLTVRQSISIKLPSFWCFVIVALGKQYKYISKFPSYDQSCSYHFYLSFFSFFFFWLCLWHIKVPEPGTEPASQQWPKPLEGQPYILNPYPQENSSLLHLN